MKNPSLSWRAIGALACLAGAAWVASASAQTVYRCTSASGQVLFSDEPCPQGSQAARINVAPGNTVDNSALREAMREQRAHPAPEAPRVVTRSDAALPAGGDRSTSFECRQAQRDYEVTAGSSSHQPALVEAKRSIMFATCGLREPDRVEAPVVVLAMGGLNGAHEQVRAHWPADRPQPATMLNGAHPFADGRLHALVADSLGGQITHAGEMWNYAAGFPHPQPHFEGHGLSIIPCKSALWLNHEGRRIGPEPLVTGFDTHWLCQQVAAQPRPWSWHLMNWRIAAKEFAISGAEHNPRIRDQQFLRFAWETLTGNHRLLRQMQRESPHFLVDDTLAGLAAKMNALTGTADVRPEVLQATADAFDAQLVNGLALSNDDQIRRIVHARQWRADRLRTCAPAPLQQRGAGPFIAIHTQLITRKSLGGLQTDLHSRVLRADGQPVSGLYCVGEAAGFGGGGASGKRSLEGTFLPGCILTARAAAQSIVTGR